mmetsp:Transcript_25995/g.38452  ORF Transcript_25995/g.38452 Transcript_25995/m.38452 type:complete len:643 (-) Transcript_25995:431-2359(-)|eukprot:CAMPEP_0195514040 /NCGR_PEP_ID=MMETSP0794_2-20130614/5555_1 /TAXON_ID=515487 /ORGANISM="Stephanopyxis turris, Strain CCMP 815" /LENGTH=642 /DNA_ID=CAMNT_0040642205 /DNA_START=161 /DNA_END=2089 /DNA_ORIENTATION=-
MVEPNFTRVDNNDFPSSFMKKDQKVRRVQWKQILHPRNFVCNQTRKRITLGFSTAFFVTLGLFWTIEFRVWHNHLRGGSRSSVTPYMNNMQDGKELAHMRNAKRQLTVTTWNIAAINNNPFEYWITYDEGIYEELMVKVESFLESPGDNDVIVSEVFTQDMFAALEKRMDGVGWPSIREYWEGDYSQRRIVSGFMKDKLLGSKRLASMPDRITNTIHLAEGGDSNDGNNVACRPTVINMYGGDLSNSQMWWKAWESFMFDIPLNLAGKKDENGSGTAAMIPYQMLQPIRQAKYPDITSEEEAVSLPLQTLCSAILDSILVHMMNTVSTPDVWQPLKSRMVAALNRQKDARTMQILDTMYGNSDVITLQEVSNAFIRSATLGSLGQKYHIIHPAGLEHSTRDQNSVILLSKQTFPTAAKPIEITHRVQTSFPPNVKIPVSDGDILAITATDISGVNYVISSFHGDTNGLATKPVLNAILNAITTEDSRYNPSNLQDHLLIFGLDANTYEHGSMNKQDVTDFFHHYSNLGLSSCWADHSPSRNTKFNAQNYTTFNARTYLQPQLNKACKSTEKRSKGDVNPKDFILFGQHEWEVLRTTKDNTGKREYVEDMAFPTLDFPSDHGVVSTVLALKNKGGIDSVEKSD